MQVYYITKNQKEQKVSVREREAIDVEGKRL